MQRQSESNRKIDRDRDRKTERQKERQTSKQRLQYVSINDAAGMSNLRSRLQGSRRFLSTVRTLFTPCTST